MKDSPWKQFRKKPEEKVRAGRKSENLNKYLPDSGDLRKDQKKKKVAWEI